MQRGYFLDAAPLIIMWDEITAGDVSKGWMDPFGNPLAFTRGTLGMDFRKLIPSLGVSP